MFDILYKVWRRKLRKHRNTTHTGETPMKTPSYIYGAFAAFCVLTFVVGMVSAVDATPYVSNSTGGNAFGHGNPPSTEMFISHLEQIGVDVTEVKTAFANGNTDAVTTWLENYRTSHLMERGNGTMRCQQDLSNVTQQQQLVTRLEQEGVDVTELKTALQNGNTDAAQTWLDSYMQAHKPARGMEMGNDRHGMDLSNSTQQQQFITRLEQEGVDVTELKTALQNGNTDAAQTWLDSYMQAHKPARGMERGNGRHGMDLSNSTQQQQLVTRLEQEGVDVTELKTALQNGNTDAAQTWLDSYMQAHKPAMGMEMGNGKPGMDLSNSTQQQQLVTRLEQEGVDITELKTALQNGNTDAAKTWLDTYFQNHRPSQPATMGMQRRSAK